MSQTPILKFFKSDHLPEHLATVSKRFEQIALELEAILPPGPEKSTALRKLLESKDAAVRAQIEPDLS